MVKIKWTEKASGDLEAIHKYIAESYGFREIVYYNYAREIKKALNSKYNG